MSDIDRIREMLGVESGAPERSDFHWKALEATAFSTGEPLASLQSKLLRVVGMIEVGRDIKPYMACLNGISWKNRATGDRIMLSVNLGASYTCRFIPGDAEEDEDVERYDPPHRDVIPTMRALFSRCFGDSITHSYEDIVELA